MKKHITRALMIALCVVFMFCTSSCVIYVDSPEQKEPTAESKAEASVADKESPRIFESVEELKKAIDNDPKYYHNKQITLKGTVLKTSDTNVNITDYSEVPSQIGVEWRYQARQCPNISITIDDEILRTAIESGDYIEVYGIVVVEGSIVFLDKCDYRIIATFEERG